jgi:hypothetical protein
LAQRLTVQSWGVCVRDFTVKGVDGKIHTLADVRGVDENLKLIEAS